MKIAAVGLALCASACAFGAEDIYVNNPQPGSPFWWWVMHERDLGETGSTDEAPGGVETEARVGQLITFAGTNRFLTTFQTQLLIPFQMPNTTLTLGVTASIRESIGGVPGALIWSGRVELASSGPASQHSVPIEFTPNVMVPDSVVITLEYDSITNEAGSTLGFYLSQALPTVGAAGTELLSQDSLSLEWYEQPDPPNRFFLRAVMRAEAGPGCYANCDGSTAPPVLNVLDFSCFLNRFGAGEAYANCDGSTAPPVLNILDFSCFLNRFSQGCP
jgi:hypothetical protein